MLELKQVVKHYHAGGEEVRAVDGVTLTLPGGQMLALQGPSGSGKTTLLLLAAGAVSADEGTVLFDGSDLALMGTTEAAQYRLGSIGLVAQQAHLMPRVSALENATTKLLLGGMSLHQARSQASHWLDRVGLSSHANRTPEELSAGERQRVAIARALAGAPRLILADEPTANLDSERSREIVSLLHSISQEQSASVLLVTHDAEAAAAADRIRQLRDGQLLPEPDPDDPRSAPQPISDSA
ncbi:MAG TPA: ABC transporter ATP-binding protein [Solirubrobacteraceae bacterium]|jgi:putative ABC transport system ATP-binding protein|nr:ABC transporter ATP-binding protein [Solirubrobacteraceae bacterium]